MKNITIIIAALFMLSSCTEVIDLKLKSNVQKVVIEGNITNQAGPYFVKITKSTELKTVGEKPTIDNADVSISDDKGNKETLKSVGGGLYQTNTLVGTEGATYTLIAKIGADTYTAKSTMPSFVALDSIKINENSFGGEKDYDFIPVYKDPVASGDIYRFLLSVNDVLMKSHFILNDLVENGLTNKQHLQNITETKFKTGDKIKVQMQKVDSKVGLYYTTLVLTTDSGPGGGTTPANPPSNISNGALGVFSAHTVQEKSTVIR
jgi:hypothetical protein